MQESYYPKTLESILSVQEKEKEQHLGKFSF